MIQKTKIVLDTDIGTDIDDAVALAYLLMQEHCDLQGITTVSGEAPKRAMIADAICRIAGQSRIPIHSGCTLPLGGVPQRQKRASHAAKLFKYKHNTNFPEETAVDFLNKIIEQNPGEIILLTIGPLTNVATLFQKYPGISSKLKAHYMMCGAFYGNSHENEWNILCDPYAAKTVFANPAPLTRVFGLNVTRKVTMKADTVRRRFQSDILLPVLDFAEIFFKEQRDFITFHDPLAAASIFDNNICEFEKGNVKVNTEQGERFGATYWEAAESSKIEIAVKVNKDKFFNEFFSKTEMCLQN